MLLPFTFIPILVLPRMHKDLNSLSLGESNASLLGVNTNGLKRKIIVLVTLAVGASVAAVGVISFIGLVVPHIIRLVAGPDNKHVLLLCILLGGIILLVADLICRTLVSPSELPLGVVISLIGAPIFLSILINQRKKSTVL
jgi:iron complex transport system permease protein